MQNLRFGILPYYIPFKYRLKTNIWLQSTNLLNLHQFTSTYFITQMLCMCVCVCAAMIVWLHKKLTLIKSNNELLCWFINLGNHPKKPHSLFTSNKWFNLKSTNNVFLLVFFFFSFSHKYWRLEFNMNDFSSTKIPNMPWFKLHK